MKRATSDEALSGGAAAAPAERRPLMEAAWQDPDKDPFDPDADPFDFDAYAAQTDEAAMTERQQQHQRQQVGSGSRLKVRRLIRPGANPRWPALLDYIARQVTGCHIA